VREAAGKPDYFTFATNHGVIQNLALMHAGLAVPSSRRPWNTKPSGVTRIQKQFGFFSEPGGTGS